MRQLGSIYEGLLEYQPHLATESMVAISDKKSQTERWVAQAKAPKNGLIVDSRESGEIYLETDRGERKATGSYYTPQYIVDYMVDQTVGPLVEQARQRVKERASQASGEAVTAAEQSFIEEILRLKLLDPVMGSGHFLVEATEYLGRALATDPYAATQEEAPTEEDLVIWKRRVVERCIYGVDKNPLAVELAKLSLWLITVAADKPLSFLDHHHDLLAYLAQQMIDLNHQQQQLTENFWLDLEGVTDEATFGKLRDKGKWESTLHRATACRPYVSPDSRATRTLDESLAWDEAAYRAFIKALAGRGSHLADLVAVYRRYAPAYQRLVTSLTTTDALIDRLVYQLYGLTAEEIALVAGEGV